MCVTVPESRDIDEVQDLSLGVQELPCCPSEERLIQNLEGLMVRVLGKGIIQFLFLKHR